MTHFLATAALAIGAVFLGLIGYQQAQPPASPVVGAFSPTGGGTYRLGQSVGTSNTSIKLSSFKEPVSAIPYTMSYLNSDIGYGTLAPQTSVSEFVSFSGITQNSDGSATLTGVIRGLSRTPAGRGCVASTTLAQAHAGQSIFILSDSPCFFAEYTPLRTNATSSAVLVFASTSPPRYDYTGAQATGAAISTTSEFASVAYVNAVALSGVSNATAGVKGILQNATGAQAGSSTILGSTGASLALTSLISTSSPFQTPTISGSVIPVTMSVTGKLSQLFWNLTEAFTWTGNHTFTATTTLATSTIIGSGVAGGLMPPGSITAYASTTAPAGWLLADGSSLLRTSYPDLFRVLGTSYGAADGTHFTLPNLLGRNILMASTTANVGQSGGESLHTLTTAEMPAHTHTYNTQGGASAGLTGGNNATLDGATSGSTGGGAQHNVLDPYFVLQYIIKY